jgi:hypothetical protein
MPRAPLAFVLMLLALAAPAEAADAPLLAFVSPEREPPDIAARLALERLKAALEASLDGLPTATLGLSRAGATVDAAPALKAIALADDAWLRSSFDAADAHLREAVAWALEHLPAVAGSPEASERLAVATARLVQVAGLTGRADDDDPLLSRALAWWGDAPMPDDEMPPEVLDLVRQRAAAATGCTGVVRWVVLGDDEPSGALLLGGRRVSLAAEGTGRLPCGTWSARRIDGSGDPSPWEWRLDVSEGRPSLLVVIPRLERALRLVGERSLELCAYPELVDDLTAVAAGRPLRTIALRLAPDGVATARDLLEPNVPLEQGATVTTSAATAPRPPSATRWAPYVLYGLSAAALATGVALNVATNGWIADQNNGTGSHFERIEAGKTGAWTAYGVAGATALAGAIWQVAIW